MQEAHKNNVLLDQTRMTLAFASFSDGKEAVAKAANVLLMKYLKSGATDPNQDKQIFTESQMAEALEIVGLYYLVRSCWWLLQPVFFTMRMQSI